MYPNWLHGDRGLSEFLCLIWMSTLVTITYWFSPSSPTTWKYANSACAVHVTDTKLMIQSLWLWLFRCHLFGWGRRWNRERFIYGPSSPGYSDIPEDKSLPEGSFSDHIPVGPQSELSDGDETWKHMMRRHDSLYRYWHTHPSTLLASNINDHKEYITILFLRRWFMNSIIDFRFVRGWGRRGESHKIAKSLELKPFTSYLFWLSLLF